MIVIVNSRPNDNRRVYHVADRRVYRDADGVHDLMLLRLGEERWDIRNAFQARPPAGFPTIHLPGQINCISPPVNEKVDVYGRFNASIVPPRNELGMLHIAMTYKSYLLGDGHNNGK